MLGGIPLLCQHSYDYHRTIGEYVVAGGFSELVLFAEGRTAGIREGAQRAGLGAEHIHDVEEKADVLEMLMRFAAPETIIYCKARHGHYLGLAIDNFLTMVAAAGFEPHRPGDVESF